MKRIMLTLAAATVVTLAGACASVNPVPVAKFEAWIEAVKPVVAEHGLVAAFRYIDQLAADGKITSREAAVLMQVAELLAEGQNSRIKVPVK